MISPIRTYRVWRHCRVPLRRHRYHWPLTPLGTFVLLGLIGIATGIAYGGW